MFQTEGRADSHDPLADLELVGVTDLQRRQIVRVDLQHRDVALLVDADHLGVERTIVVQLDGHMVGTVHHMGIGQDVAVGIDDKSRAFTGDLLLAAILWAVKIEFAVGGAKLAEELQQRIVRVHPRRHAIKTGMDHLADVDTDHRGRRLLYEAGEVRQTGHGLGRRRRYDFRLCVAGSMKMIGNETGHRNYHGGGDGTASKCYCAHSSSSSVKMGLTRRAPSLAIDDKASGAGLSET